MTLSICRNDFGHRPCGFARALFSLITSVAVMGAALQLLAATAAESSPPPGSDAAFVSQEVPATMMPGESYEVTVTMRNTGTTTWTFAGRYKLGSSNPRDNTIWGFNRVRLPSSVSVLPDMDYTFVFNVTAPAVQGTHDFQWQMLQENVASFGAKTPNVPVNVPAAIPNAAFVAQEVPAVMNAGQTYEVKVAMENTGNTTWKFAYRHKLGSVNPRDNMTWGLNRVRVPFDVAVPPGVTHTFLFNVTAPMEAGVYDFQWQMLQENMTRFGQTTPNLAVDVRATGYVANFGSGTVSVIDMASNAVLSTVAVGSGPDNIVINSKGDRAFVSNRQSHTVSVINTLSNAVTATIPMDPSPVGIAINPAGTRLYVGNQGNNRLSVVETATNTVVTVIPIGNAPTGVAVDASGSRVYAANYGANSVSVIDTATNTVAATILGVASPTGLAFNATNNHLYAANYESASVSVIDLSSNSVLATVPVGGFPIGLTVHPTNGRVYVMNSNSDNVSVIDPFTNGVVATVAVGDGPFLASFNRSLDRLFVANERANSVSVIDPATNLEITSFPVGNAPRGVAVRSLP